MGDLQARFIATAWKQDDLFEDSEAVRRSVQSDIVEDCPPHYLHLLGGRQWEYCARLAHLAGFYSAVEKKLQELEQIYQATGYVRLTMPSSFKSSTLCQRDGEWYFKESVDQ